MTNAQPIKAWWACFLGMYHLQDKRSEVALRKAFELFQKHRSHIDDLDWRNEFSTRIEEHRALLQAVRELEPAIYKQVDR